MIVWLASYPRSGNSFFRVVCRRLYGLIVYSVYQEKYAPVDRSRLSDMAKAPELFFVKTHHLPRDDFPAIHLVRDGRDVLVSYAWYHMPEGKVDTATALEAYRRILKNLIVSNTSFGGWGPHVLAWTYRSAHTVPVKFEDFVQEPERIVQEALLAVGYQPERIKGRKLLSFEEQHQRNPRLYRKGQIGGWRTDMPPHLHDLFWERHGEAMRAMGYSR